MSPLQKSGLFSHEAVVLFVTVLTACIFFLYQIVQSANCICYNVYRFVPIKNTALRYLVVRLCVCRLCDITITYMQLAGSSCYKCFICHKYFFCPKALSAPKGIRDINSDMWFVTSFFQKRCPILL